MEIDSFDYFLHEIYKTCELLNTQIDTIATERFEKRQAFRLSQNPFATLPILLNAIKVKYFPKTVFTTSTNITGIGKWKKLREAIGNAKIVASFSKNDKLMFFGVEQEIKETLKNYITDDLKIADIPEYIYFHSDSFYLGMLYELIKNCLVNDYGLSCYVKGRAIRKFFSPENPLSEAEISDIKRRKVNFSIQQHISIFEAFEFKIEFVNKELYLLICPTIHIQLKGGGEPPKNVVQFLSNTILSNRYNNKYGQKMTWWLNELKKKNSKLNFKLGDFEINLSQYYSTAAQKVNDTIFCFSGYSKLNEPSIYFHYQDEAKQSIHPINGLKILGPLEESYDQNVNGSAKVNLAIISPDFGFERVKTHLKLLLSAVSEVRPLRWRLS